MPRPFEGVTANARLVLGALHYEAPVSVEDEVQRTATFQRLCGRTGLPSSSVSDALRALMAGGRVQRVGHNAYVLSPEGGYLFKSTDRGARGFVKVPAKLVKRLGRCAGQVLDTVYALADLKFSAPWDSRRVRVSLRELGKRVGHHADTVGAHLRRALEAGLLKRRARRPWEPGDYTFSVELDADAEASSGPAPAPGEPKTSPAPAQSAEEEAAALAENLAAADAAWALVKAHPAQC